MKVYWVNVRKANVEQTSHLRTFSGGMSFVALYFRKKDALRELGKDKDIFKTIKITLRKD